jgi:Mg2+ and Co2+ transporter CorA
VKRSNCSEVTTSSVSDRSIRILTVRRTSNRSTCISSFSGKGRFPYVPQLQVVRYSSYSPKILDRQFHFRGTPHPQNVRRRIKSLKDYISVTSDWISYALIDDITDAFGPLIQSIEYEVDGIDELVLILKEAEQSDMLRR